MVKKIEPELFAVIMAGGGGTRLWPWSRKEQPKQMLKIVSGKSMFELTIERLKDVVTPDHILVVTTAEQVKGLKNLDGSIPDDNYIIEPIPRGTASVIGLAAVVIQHRSKRGIMAVVTADHVIKNVKLFEELLLCGFNCADEGHLVTIGIRPGTASTAMGYIEQGELLSDQSGHEIYKVKRFIEKPESAAAQRFIQTGRYNWNSGMFIWRADRILEEFTKYLPETYSVLNKVSQAIDDGKTEEVMTALWPTLKPDTIDYGIMEKAEDVVVIPSHALGWNDIGSWESIYGVVAEDAHGNIHINCKSMNLDTHGTLVCSENKDKLIVTIGLTNMIVVETDKAVMVCPRSDAQKVKEIVAMLKDDKKLQQYL